MLHTCWCIGFVCLNSNLHLNSFVCCFSKSEKPIPFSFSFLPYSRLFLFEPKTFKSAEAPSTPVRRQPATPATQRPRSPASQPAHRPPQAVAQLCFWPSRPVARAPPPSLADTRDPAIIAYLPP
jgi:hypothetical protein